MRRHICTALLSFIVIASVASPAAANPFALSYGGRLTDPSGKPIQGPINVEVSFFAAESGGAPLGSGIQSYSAVPLVQGVFTLKISLSSTGFHGIFSDINSPVWIEIKDLTHNTIYPRQKFQTVPFAALVPVDGKTVSFDSTGRLKVGPTTPPTAGQFLTQDGSGNFIWASPPAASATLQGYTVNAPTPVAGNVLQFDGTDWRNSPISMGSLSSVSAVAPFAVATPSTTPAISMPQAASGIDGYLSFGDWLAFNNKQPSLGFTAVNKAGDSLSGSLNMGGNPITTLAAPTLATDAASKTFVDSAFTPFLKKDGSTPLAGDWAVANHDLIGVKNLQATNFITSNRNAVRIDPWGTTTSRTGEVHFSELSILTGRYVGFKAPDTISTSTVWTLPASDGAAGHVLRTNGSGQLSWIDPSAVASSVQSVAGRTGAVTLTTSDVAEGAINKYQTDANARGFAVADSISDSVTSIAPSQNSMFDALAGKIDLSGGTMTGALDMGTQAITGVNNLSTGSLTTSEQAAIVLEPFGAGAGQTSELRLKELSVVEGHSVGFKAPDSVPTSQIWTLPSADGTNGQVLKTDGSGTLGWVNAYSLTLADSISDGTSNTAPSQNAVFDALALKLDKTGGTLSGVLNMGTQKITDLAPPTLGTDAATKAYTDAAVGPYLKKDGLEPLTGHWAVGGFNISGVDTFEAGATSLSTLSTTAQAGFTAKPFGLAAGETSEVRLKDLSGSLYQGFKAADALGASQIWTLPGADGSANQVLKTDGASHLSWVDASSLFVVDAINDSAITTAPTQNATFDALALKLDKSGGTMSGAIDMGAQKITSLASPTLGSDAATKSYADGVVAPYVKRDGTTPLTGNWTVGGFNIQGVGTFSAGATNVSSLRTSTQAGVTLSPFGTSVGETAEIRFRDLTGTGRYVGFKAPDSIAADQIFVLPATDGTANFALSTDGAGTLAWTNAAAASVADNIADGVTTLAPSQNAVFDALALKLNKSGGTMSGALDLGGHAITNLGTPTAGSDAITKTYADGLSAPYLEKDGSTSLTAAWATGGFNITGVGSFSTNAATFGTLATTSQAAASFGPFGTSAGNTAEVRFKELTGGNYVGFKAPDSISTDQIWVLPAADGAANTILQTNGAGALNWTTAASLAIEDAIVDGVTEFAPTQNAVFDAIALKLPLTGGTLTGPLDMASTHKITNLATPTLATDAATKAYADGVVAPYLLKDGSTPLSANWGVGGFAISNVGAFTATSVSATGFTTTAQAALTVGNFNTGPGQNGEIRFKDLSATNYVGFKAPDTITTSRVWTLPTADGLSGEVLKTNGAGQLSWTAAGSASVQDSITDGITTVAPSQNAVFDALALKLPLSGGTLSGPLNMNTTRKITGLATPVSGSDAASKAYIDTKLSDYVKADGTVPLTGSWNAGGFNITGINALSATDINVGGFSTSTQAGVTLSGYGVAAGNTGELRLRDLDQSHSIGFSAPDAIATNRIWTLPNSDGSANQVLTTDGTGNLGWTSPSALTVADAIVNGVTNIAPSQNSVFDALALKLNKSGGTLTGALEMSGNKITNLATPTDPTDAATMSYADGVFGPYLKRDGSTTLTAAWNAGGFNITGVGAFTASGAANVSSITTSAQAAVTLNPYNTGAGQTAEILFRELSVVENHSVGFKAPNSVSSSQIWTLPSTYGTADQLLKTDGLGNLAWTSASALAVTQSITDTVVNRAPSENAVFNALALKASTTGATLSGSLAMSSNKITGLATPSATSDAATMAYADSALSPYVKRDGTTPLIANWAAGGFNFSGVGTLGAGAATVSSLSSSGSVSGTSFSSSAQAAFVADPWGVTAGRTGEVQFKALTGSNYVGFKAPDVFGANTIWTLPSADGAANTLLKTDGAGNLAWASAASLAISQSLSSGVTNRAPSEGVVFTALSDKVNKSGDTMTGALALPADGLTVGTSQFVVKNGKLGIGEVDPGFPLTFAATAGSKVSLYGAGAAHYGFGIGLGAVVVHTMGATDDIAFGYGTSDAFTQTSVFEGTGNVGIGTGTGTPVARLHVLTTGAAATETNVAILDSNNGGTGSGVGIDFKGSSTSGTGAGYLAGIAAVDAGTADGQLEFRTSGDGVLSASRLTNSSTRMTIKDSGHVGIGTSSPAARLHVQKNVPNATEEALMVLDSNNFNTNAGGSLQFKNSSTTGAGFLAAIAAVDDTGADGRLEFRVSGDGTSSASSLSNTSTRMVIKQSGNIGINESSPGMPLNFQSVVGDKISFHGLSANHYGFGVQAGQLQIHSDVSGTDVVFGHILSGTWTEMARIRGNKRMGIGTANPSSTLHLADGGIHVENTTGSAGMALGTCPLGACSFPFETLQLGGGLNLRIYSGATERFVFNNDGAARKGGTLSWENISDIRTKHVHGTYTLGLKEVLQLNPIVYSYKKDNPRSYNSEAEYVGFSAQAVQKVIPQAIRTDEQGYLSLTADPIIWAMFNAIKEENALRKNQQATLSEQFQTTRSELSVLKTEFRAKGAQLKNVKSKLDKLVNAVCKDGLTKDCQP